MYLLTDQSLADLGAQWTRPPANEVWGKIIFSQASVILSSGGGGGSASKGGGVMQTSPSTMGYGQQAGGPDPTGILYCFIYMRFSGKVTKL